LVKINFNNNILYHSIRLVLGLVFIFASMDKIIHPLAFAQTIFNYQVLTDVLINPAALILPWLELFIGGCLLLNRWMSGAASIVVILMSIFVGVLFFNLSRGLDINCGCFSSSSDETPMNGLTLFRDISFLILASCLLFLNFYKKN